MSAMRRPLFGRLRRGFTLVLAAALVVLVVAIAETVARFALSDLWSSTLETAEVNADYIAESGLMRTMAYLMEMARVEPDFDLALDPNLDTTCSFPSRDSANITIGGSQTDDHMLPFADGVFETMPGTGARYTKVPFSGGAYYVRVDDNSDDGHEGWNCKLAGGCGAGNYKWWNRNNIYPLATNNRDLWGVRYMPGYIPPVGNPALTCPEANSPEVNQLQDNPVRDRDRMLVVTVVGFYPGTQFPRARARKSYRLLVAPMRQSPAVTASGNAVLGSASVICGLQGGVHANGNVVSSSPACTCGDVTAVGTSPTSFTVCNNTTQCPPLTGVAPVCIQATGQGQFTPLSIPALQPNALDPKFMNDLKAPALGVEPSYFFFARDGSGYVWDFNRTAVGAESCGAFAGALVPRPCSDAALKVTNAYGAVANEPWCHCWVPIFYATQPVATPHPPNPYATVDDTICDAASYGTTTPVGGYCPGSMANALRYNNDGSAPLRMTPSGACDPRNDCAGDGWIPMPPATTNSYDWTQLTSPASGTYSGAAALVKYNPEAGALWQLDLPASDADLPDGIFYFDGLATDRLNIQANAVNAAATVSVVTPMQVLVKGAVGAAQTNTMSAPSWAPDFAIISSSLSSTTPAWGAELPASCVINPTTTAANQFNINGQVLCSGHIKARNMTLMGSITAAGGGGLDSHVLVSASRIIPNQSLLQWMSIPVAPSVWTEGTF